jgi:membrane associated rhomboid family serine protease
MDIRSIAIASGVAIFYGGMIWGIFPLQPTVSWESHLFGGIIGIVLAFLYRHTTETTKNIERIEQEHKRKSFDDYMNQS